MRNTTKLPLTLGKTRFSLDKNYVNGSNPYRIERDSAERFTGVRCTVGHGELIQPPIRLEEVVMTSRPVGQKRHCFLVIGTNPVKVQEF